MRERVCRIFVLEVLEADLLEIQDDLSDIFDNAGERSKFVLGASDANGSNRCTFQGREQHAA